MRKLHIYAIVGNDLKILDYILASSANDAIVQMNSLYPGELNIKLFVQVSESV